MTIDKIISDLSPRKFGKLGVIWTVVLIIVSTLGVISYIRQLNGGLAVTGLRDYAFWGIYISNFVFFVAISLVGSLVTSILRLSGAKWSIPITRISEIIAVSAIIMAGLTIIVDMGRPDRLWHLFVYGRLQSPIIWDVLVITTYLFVSVMLLFFPLLPDFALLKTKFNGSTFLKKWYGKLSLNWSGTSLQHRKYNQAIKYLSIMIIPLAFGIHTVTAWLFATTFRPGWDSTNFGAYFVAGAFVAGAGGVIATMFILRKTYGLQEYITDDLFDKMGKLLAMLCLLYLYFNINEYLIPAYKLKKEEEIHLYSLLFGHYATLFWSVIVFGLVLPVVVIATPKGRKPLPLFIISILVVVAAWWKRFLIVAPTLLHPFMPKQGIPESWTEYSPTYDEWAITIGTLAMALLIMTFLVRVIPIVPIQEFKEYITEKENEKA
ncbi:MAG: polysulfide reductase NrfD [Cyclobacteriaceae bacterium]|nr:polysulfide reductase NrfD [Cyclobacteriaceae bacterium]